MVQVSWLHRQQQLLIAYQFVHSHKLCVAAWTQPCSSEMLPSSPLLHRFSFQTLPAPCVQLKEVVKSHQQQLITCTETKPGDRGKRNAVLIPVWDIATRLETFSPFQGPAHMQEATNIWMQSWMLLTRFWHLTENLGKSEVFCKLCSFFLCSCCFVLNLWLRLCSLVYNTMISSIATNLILH